MEFTADISAPNSGIDPERFRLEDLLRPDFWQNTLPFVSIGDTVIVTGIPAGGIVRLQVMGDAPGGLRVRLLAPAPGELVRAFPAATFEVADDVSPTALASPEWLGVNLWPHADRLAEHCEFEILHQGTRSRGVVKLRDDDAELIHIIWLKPPPIMSGRNVVQFPPSKSRGAVLSGVVLH